ncbi:hypothetical protein BJ165DRAFT_1534192 [Panaeolus papilionaceus]|nr:hypothetical protein BJ165DRAFT_1534192 [Panaeolus papilionaceus]
MAIRHLNFGPPTCFVPLSAGIMATNTKEPSQKKRKPSDDASNDSSTSVSSSLLSEGAIKKGSLWFDDGSIDTVLAPQLQNSGDEGLVEGCTVVHLHDSAKDLEFLLNGIYHYPNAGTPPIADTVVMPVEMASSFLRLGNKYDVPHLRDNALDRIQKEYPSGYRGLTASVGVYLEGSDSWDFDVVTLAHEESVFSALRVALFFITISYETVIFEGVDCDDGTKAVLLTAMVNACLEGRDKMAKALSKISFAWLVNDPVQAKCTSVKECTAFFRLLRDRIFFPVPDVAFCLIHPWTKISTNVVCKHCERYSKKAHEGGEKGVLEKFPSMFGFGTWEDVKHKDRK